MLTAALAFCLLAQGASTEMRLMRNPDIHGDKVVFTYAADLWLTDIQGGFARRLTSHPGVETDAKFSPDGSMIAFTAMYDGNPDVYVMPADGGEPKRLTFDPEGDRVAGWTPDGKIAYVSNHGASGVGLPRLWLLKPNGGMPMPTDVLEVSDLSFSPDGKRLVYNRSGSHSFNWRRYRGGTQGVISFWDFGTGAYSEIPHERENSWYPMWVGNAVFYASDKNQGTVNLFRFDTQTKQIKQVTKFADTDIKWPSTDGKRIVFEKDGYLMTYQIADGKLSKLSPQVVSDKLLARPGLRRLGMDVRNVAISPSGKRIVVEARGDLFSVPAKNGDTRPLVANPGIRAMRPQWSPDGKTIAYLSDGTGEVCIYTVPQMGGASKKIDTEPGVRLETFQWSPDGKSMSYTALGGSLYVLDLATGKSVKVFQSKYGGADQYDWSPDSKWIAYIDQGNNLFGASYLYEVATKKATKVTEGYYGDGAVTFDLNGLYLYLVSARSFNPTSGDFEMEMGMKNTQRVYVVPLAKSTPSPFYQADEEEAAGQKEAPKKDGAKGKIDLDGLAARALPLPVEPGNYQGLVGVEGGVLIYTQNKLMLFDLDSKQAQDVVGNIRAIDFTPKRDKMAFLYGPYLCMSDVKPGIDPNGARVNTSAIEATVDPREEWKQIYWEAWRYERDNFYDSQMLGLDWRQIGDHYASFLPYVAHRDDLNYVLGLLIGELGTSHAYVGGGDMGVVVPGVNVGCLGADYEVANGFVRFKRIYRGFNFEENARGPLGEPGIDVKEGEYLVGIDGNPVTEARGPSEFLQGKAGRYVVLQVNDKPSLEGARTVRVRAVSAEGRLRYETWVEDNRRKVAELSGGRIGYMHVPNTSEEGIIGMIKGYYSQSDKDAMIVDERFNGGGNIPTFLIEKLARHIMTAVKGRYGADVPFPPQTVSGPMAMLINGYAGSGGDLFPWLFRDAKLGPLIGTRTWGGLVGIGGSAPLIDGGFLSAPGFGLYDVKTGAWIAENRGIDPDIEVDARPDLIAKGRDPQLEKAVEVLMEQLKKGKTPIKQPDTYPRVKPPKKN